MSTIRQPAAARLGATILLIASCSAWAGSETPAMSDYMNCARGLGVAFDNSFVVLPGERYGDRGLYVYTDQGAHFLPLGAPDAENGEAQEYFLRTHVSNVGEILLNYRGKKPGSKSNIQPGISYQTMGPAAAAPGNHRATPARHSPDEQAANLLRLRLREKIATIKNFIDDKNRYSTPVEAKRMFEQDRQVYLAKLERCRIADDRKLNIAVAEEMEKLKSGLPGITIWEKEVASLASLTR